MYEGTTIFPYLYCDFSIKVAGFIRKLKFILVSDKYCMPCNVIGCICDTAKDKVINKVNCAWKYPGHFLNGSDFTLKLFIPGTNPD